MFAMRKFILFFILSPIYFLGYSQSYTWPIAGKNAGDDIIYKPQSYLDGNLLYADLIIKAEFMSPVVAPTEGRIDSYYYTYQDAYQRSTTFGEVCDWYNDSLKFVEFGDADIKHIGVSAKIIAKDGRNIWISGLRPCDNIITGKSVKAGDTIGYVGYYYNIINHPCINVKISEKGKTSAGDPMTSFGLQTTFKKIKNTKRPSSLSREQAVEDYAILVEALKEGFPGIYDYVSEEEFNDYVKTQFDGFTEKVLMEIFERSIMGTLFMIKDSHTRVINPYDENPKTNLISLSYIDGSLIVYRTTPAYSQYHGKKVKSVDGIESDSLMKMLKDYIHKYDGYNQSGIEEDLAVMFDLRYCRFIQDLERNHDLTLEFEDAEIQTFKAESLGGGKCISLKPYIQDWYVINRFGPGLNGVNIKNINDSIAYLGIQTFDLKEKQLDEVADFIKQISRDSIDNLIIDMRNNFGGNVEVLNKLYSFIAQEDFQHEMYSMVTKKGDFDFFKHSTNHIMGDILFDDYEYDENSGYYVKYHNEVYSPDTSINYCGKVYVITNESTMSAASSFAGLVKKHDRGVIVGRETGTAYHQMKALKFEKLYLPNSSYIINIPLVKIVADTVYNELFPYGRGVLPDYPVRISLEEIECRNGDKVLNYTLQLIEENKYIERPVVESVIVKDVDNVNDGREPKYLWLIVGVTILTAMFLKILIFKLR